jgi:hypothetical protein
VKALIRKLAYHARTWLRPDEQDAAQNERARFDKFAYGELNGQLLEIVHGTGGPARPNYTWAILQSAYLAKMLGLSRISAIEFGVAGGNGLVSLEHIAREVGKRWGIIVDVIGFDTGEGLPAPTDYRDLPHLYEHSTYKMDQAALKSRLSSAKLFLGLIEQTLPQFIASNPAPVGFIAVDVDLYTSTVDSLKLLEADQQILMPRIHCYFDDILGFSFASFNGERLAIEEFNQTHEKRKVSPIYGLRYFVPKSMADQPWIEGTYMAHILDHNLYGRPDGSVQLKQEHLRGQSARS